MKTRQPFSARDYYSDPRRRLKSAFVRGAGRLLGPLGFDLELSHYYSPIPHADDRPVAWWERPSELPGVALDLERQLEFIERELGEHLAEFQPPRGSIGRLTYHLENGLFQAGDGDLLYAVIRRFKPARVLEVGAGFSTLAAAAAAQANRAEGHMTELVSCDPNAVAPSEKAIPGLAEIKPIAAEDLPLEEFTSLGPNDILFIDSSHTVRIGGDVVYLFCEVLPRLEAGVLVHVHDVYLPWPYPRAWVAHNRWYWSEQYLLQALLCENANWDVLISAFALHRLKRVELERLIPNLLDMPAPLSFWVRRVAPAR